MSKKTPGIGRTGAEHKDSPPVPRTKGADGTQAGQRQTGPEREEQPAAGGNTNASVNPADPGDRTPANVQRRDSVVEIGAEAEEVEE